MNYRELQAAVRQLKTEGYVIAHQPLNADKNTLQWHYAAGMALKAQDLAYESTGTSETSLLTEGNETYLNEHHSYRSNSVTIMTIGDVLEHEFSGIDNPYFTVAEACTLATTKNPHQVYGVEETEVDKAIASDDTEVVDHAQVLRFLYETTLSKDIDTSNTEYPYCNVPIHNRIIPSDMLDTSYLDFLMTPFINCLGQRVETTITAPYLLPFSEYFSKWIECTGDTSYSCHSYHYHQAAIEAGITQDVNNGQSSALTCYSGIFDPTEETVIDRNGSMFGYLLRGYVRDYNNPYARIYSEVLL